MRSEKARSLVDDKWKIEKGSLWPWNLDLFWENSVLGFCDGHWTQNEGGDSRRLGP